jgi:hypothetical protein
MIFKILKSKPKAPIMKMVVPGPRALGIQWEEVTLRPSEDGGHIETERQATAAPATGLAHIIPAMGNLSSEEVDFILEGSLKASEYESRKPRRQPVTDAEIQQMVQQMWLDYMEQKIRAFDGRSTFGLGGHTQRQSWGGPKEFNPRAG